MKIKIITLVLVTTAAHAAQLQTYPQVTSVGVNDLVPFSQFLGGTSWNSPVNITGPNFANAMAILGGYPGLGLANVWTQGQVVQGNSLYQANLTVNGTIRCPSIGGPPGSLIYDPGFTLSAVTLGSNLTLVAGVLSATSSVTTNAITLPLAQTNGGTGTATPALIPMAIGAAYANGTTVFPGIFDSGPPSNTVLVIEGSTAGPVITNVAVPPANGLSLISTNTTPGMFWGPLPNNGTSTTTGSGTATGWTNNTGFYADVISAGANMGFHVFDNAGNNWADYTFPNAGSSAFITLQPNGSMVAFGGGFSVIKWHVH